MNLGGLSIQPTQTDGHRLVKLAGELDLSNTEAVLAAFAISDELGHLTVDTTELTFIDSSGLHALADAQEEVSADRFRLVPGAATLRLLELTGIGDTFGIDI